MKKIDQLRQDKNITQKQLSSAIGKSREWYSTAMTRNNLTVNDFRAIADVLDVDPCVLLGSPRRSVLPNRERSFLKKEVELQADMISVMKELIDKQSKEITALKDQLDSD